MSSSCVGQVRRCFPRICAATATVVLLTYSCTRLSNIPVEGDPDIVMGTRYRILTTSGAAYDTRDLRLFETEVTFTSNGERLTIQRTDIISIQSVEVDPIKTTIVAVSVVGLATVAIVLLFGPFVETLGGAD